MARARMRDRVRFGLLLVMLVLLAVRVVVGQGLGEWAERTVAGWVADAAAAYKAVTVLAGIAAGVLTALRLLLHANLSMTVFSTPIIAFATLGLVLPFALDVLSTAPPPTSDWAHWLRANIIKYVWE